MRRLILLLVVILNIELALAQNENGHGTLMLLYSTKDTIFLAADTRTSIDRNDGSHSSKINIKLAKAANSYFGTSGLSYMAANGKTLFVMKDHFRERLSIFSTQTQAIQYLITGAARDLQAAIQTAIFKGAVPDPGESFLDIFVCSFENNIPHCNVVAFKLTFTKNSISVIEVGHPPLENGKLWPSGRNELVSIYQRSNPKISDDLKNNPMNEMLKIFRFAANRDSSVGFPVFMYKIHKSGALEVTFEK